MFENSGIVSSLNQIKKNLVDGLERKYGIKDDDKVNSILKIHGLHKDNIDVIKNIESFIEASKFYEDKGYTLNLCLDETQSRLDWISTMLNCCRSNLVYKNGKYSLFVEKADEVVQYFDPDTINDLELWWSPMEDIPDRIYVQYIDPENEWVKVNAQAEASAPLRKQPRIETYELYGVTNFDQASRLA